MDLHGPTLVIAIIAICTIGTIVNNLIRARHGYEPTNDWGSFGGRFHGGKWGRRLAGGKDDDLDDTRRLMLLTNENEKLAGQVNRLEERIAVLERIATDPAERTARAIDALR